MGITPIDNVTVLLLLSKRKTLTDTLTHIMGAAEERISEENPRKMVSICNFLAYISKDTESKT